MIIGTLRLIANRLPIAFRYDCDELGRYVGFARELVNDMGDQLGTESVTTLERLSTQGGELLEGARTDPQEIEAAIFELRAAVGQTIQQVNATAPVDVRKALRKRVLDMSKQELERERALVVDMGFESDPEKRPPPIELQLPPIRHKRKQTSHHPAPFMIREEP